LWARAGRGSYLVGGWSVHRSVVLGRSIVTRPTIISGGRGVTVVGPWRRRPGGTVNFPIPRHIDTLVPVVIDKVDRIATGIVPVAIPLPIVPVFGRHAQINRLIARHNGANDDRLRIYQLRLGKTANVNLTIKSRLADADRNASEGVAQRHDRQDGNDTAGCDGKKFLHRLPHMYMRGIRGEAKGYYHKISQTPCIGKRG
jgi:hypothetical protein